MSTFIGQDFARLIYKGIYIYFFSISSQENGATDLFRAYRGPLSGFAGPPRGATSPTKSLTGSVASSNGFSSEKGGDKSKPNAPPDKPGRSKVDVKKTISKHQNWLQSITGSASTPSGAVRQPPSTTADSVDSSRRSSVHNDHKPALLSGGFMPNVSRSVSLGSTPGAKPEIGESVLKSYKDKYR